MSKLDPATVEWFAKALTLSEFHRVPTTTYEEQMLEAEHERQYLAARNTARELLRDNTAMEGK